MAASITLAGESLIAQKLAAGQVLTVARFVLANVPGLNTGGAVNRAGLKPPAAQVVFTSEVTQVGFVNPNQVVYSLMMGTDIGDFDWNWIGLETTEGVLLSVAYVPLQQKRKNILPTQIGNNVTRNLLVVFDGAQQLTAIKVDASTWQHDFTARLKGIDERERVSNRDMFGRACFFGSGLMLEKVGAAYQLKAGLAYVEGIRLERTAVLPVVVPSVPNKAWLDVALQRDRSDVLATYQVVFGAGKVDYNDSAGARHYLVPLADLPTSSSITDLRTVEAISTELIKHLAAQSGDYPRLRARATTKDDVGLSNIPNAISDDVNSDSSTVLATTRLVRSVRSVLTNAIAAIIDGTSIAGKAARLATARTFKFKGAATGTGSFDGSADSDITLTLADSGATAGSYTKVTINAKGLATGGSNPTSLAGYGITDGYTKAQADLAFVKQGTGIGQARNAVHIGWSTKGLLATVDESDLGRLWYEKNFDPSSKADKASSLSGYGITDAYTKTESNGAYVKQGGGIGQLANKINIGWSGSELKATVDAKDLGKIWTSTTFNPNDKANVASSLEGYGIADAYTKTESNVAFVKQGGGVGQTAAKVNIGWSSTGLKVSVDDKDLGKLWNESSFNPADKADKASTLAGYGISNCYTMGQVDDRIQTRAGADAITYVGFAGDNPSLPYLRRKSDGVVYYLQPSIGFMPVQQGGGANQGMSRVRLGWSNIGYGIRAQVDTTDLGIQWGEHNFFQPNQGNFLAVALEGTSVQLPAGGTWCYSLMHYYRDGRGVVGKSGQAAGGTLISFSGGLTIYGFAWRYAP